MILSEINIYPIKSLKGISLKEAKTERRGLRFDRRWMLVDEKNELFTQREFPRMATIETRIGENGLQVSQNGNNLEIPFSPNGDETARVRVWSSKCAARVYENPVNEWFSDVLGTKCKLVLMPEETERRVNYFYAVHKDDHVSFADGYPFLLIGENSLADLNSRLEDDLPMNRFRPNFVVKDAEPFAEDGWKKIRIGESVFHVVKPCARCVITTIDQATGEKGGKEPLKTLASFRVPKRSLKKKILFGQNLIVEKAGEVLRVGDEIEVLETKNKPKFL
ncbi:MAG TPA: MOSC N-terminal beta barrel domain-containing protein [Pyrinomonadaceae bacterium]|nr:MOSC N-terminal beta barrel domain-containing protein [Pyrinomonadaceae bacterium]